MRLRVNILVSQGRRFWKEADGALLCHVLAVDPVQDVNVLAETRPDETSLLVLTDLGKGSVSAGPHAELMLQVVAKVVPKEVSHGEGVVHDHLCLVSDKAGWPVTLAFPASRVVLFKDEQVG